MAVYLDDDLRAPVAATAVTWRSPKRQRTRSVAGVLVLLWLAGAAGVGIAHASRKPFCSNFGEVRTGFYRGAEPDDRCLSHLLTLGVRTIVSLRNDEEASRREREKVVALGMQYVNIPMSGFDRPSYAVVQRILEIVGSGEDQPVYLHCRQGRDRTGVIVAAYRMTREGWTVDRALQEARSFGMGWWQLPMKQFVRDFGDETAKVTRTQDERSGGTGN